MLFRYENTGAGSSLLCFASSAACDDPDWVVDSSDATSGVPSCTGIQDLVSQSNITNNITEEDCTWRGMTSFTRSYCVVIILVFFVFVDSLQILIIIIFAALLFLFLLLLFLLLCWWFCCRRWCARCCPCKCCRQQ